MCSACYNRSLQCTLEQTIVTSASACGGVSAGKLGWKTRAAKAREIRRGFGGMHYRGILKSKLPEIPFPAFLEEVLQNSEGFKMFIKC